MISANYQAPKNENYIQEMENLNNESVCPHNFFSKFMTALIILYSIL